ncbi:MAG: hypothetical protein CSA52_02200 [Gammaproteobacteria bacterium]|nr:MAG: hypothetical protein CSB48_06185 [Pseudomonadota bacterium]PIE38405.1 MAG: hypothetical protein CSA52_02200 [Gammaproteobacteria bacterium]
MKRVFGVLFVCILLIPLLFKGLLWFQVTTQLKETRKAFEPYGLLEWGGIYSTFDGKIGVSDFAVTPFQLKDSVMVESLEVDFGSLEELLKAALPMLEGKYPDSLTFLVKQARLVLSDSSLAALKTDNERLANISPARIHACGDVKMLSGRELRAMGFDAVEYNAMLSYQLHSADGRLDVVGLVEALGMGEYSVKARLAYPGGYVSLGQLLSDSTVKALSVQMKDLGYYRRLAFLCGRLNHLSQSEYIAASLREWEKNLLQSGISIAPGFIASLNEYMAMGEKLELMVRPENGLFAPFLSAGDKDGAIVDLETVIGGLRPAYALASGPYRPLTVRIDKARWKRVLIDPAELERRRKEERSKGSANSQVVIERKFVPVQIGSLNRHSGKKVRVTDLQGKVYQGVLAEVLENKIVVTIMMDGGSFSFPVNRESIRLVEIMKAVKVKKTSPENALNRGTP